MPEFKDTKFMTAKEKQTVIRAWERFLKNGCKPNDFTKALYHHLINHCSFIAHYDLGGFYSTYFSEPEDTDHFLNQFDRSKGCKSIEYGGSGWVRNGNDVTSEYYDINNAMCDVATKYIPAIRARVHKEQENLDVERAHRLLAKHGIKAPGFTQPEGGEISKTTTQPSMF